MTLYKNKAYFEFFDKNGIKLTESCYFFDEASISNNVSYNNAEISGKNTHVYNYATVCDGAKVSNFAEIINSKISGRISISNLFIKDSYINLGDCKDYYELKGENIILDECYIDIENIGAVISVIEQRKNKSKGFFKKSKAIIITQKDITDEKYRISKTNMQLVPNISQKINESKIESINNMEEKTEAENSEIA